MLKELLAMAAGNLWRMKLRTGLTAAGIVIGIGALVAMLSFSFGMQHNVTAEFRALKLFRTLHVMPAPAAPAGEGETAPAALYDAAIERIAAFDGVELVYPQDTFDARIEWGSRHADITAQALPASFGEKRGMKRMVAGRFFSADSVAETVVSARLVKRLETSADSILGQTLRLRTAGRAQLVERFLEPLLERMGLPERARAIAAEVTSLFTRQFGRNECAVVVVGVAEPESGWGFQIHDVLLPSRIAGGLDRLSFSNPLELLSRLGADGGGYPLAVVTLRDDADQEAVRVQVEGLGLRAINFAAEFEEMRRAFLIFDVLWGVIGVIALAVASLGIANTMIMSVLERVREIGVLKSLGATDGHVRGIFLAESALIGLTGSVGGVLLGWAVSRVASVIVRRVLVAQGNPEMDLFYLPAYIALGAIAFGVGVSLLAGLLPAARAARTDPVRALRHE
ncbi:MAG: ABC transporter permease [Candidatus Eisenbacteria bacterium]